MNKPDWICIACAAKRGRWLHPEHRPTWHFGKCGDCKETAEVTQLRDFAVRENAMRETS